MELTKVQDNLVYPFEDVKFFVRTPATAGDRYELSMLGDWRDGKVVMKKGDYFLKVIELFVVGWDGVTEGGKPVPYSYETFMRRFPVSPKQDLILTMGAWIAEKVGLLSIVEQKKEG